MPAAPAANRIHSLPVLVNYQLPSSSSFFTTLFTAPQQVYVHANAAVKGDTPDATWGSIYLKTIAQGVLMASPELFPGSPDTLDPSLYVLDPRETSLRRHRASLALARAADASSPPHASSSTLASSSSVSPDPSADVWAGKGLLSWALNEPGQGKNLITGRLICSPDFAPIVKPSMTPLDALVASNGVGWWGIEVSVSVRDNSRRAAHIPGVQGASVMMPDIKPSLPLLDSQQIHARSGDDRERRLSAFSDASDGLRSSVVPSREEIRARPRHIPPQPRAHPSTSPIRPSRAAQTQGGVAEDPAASKRKAYQHSHTVSADHGRALQGLSTNAHLGITSPRSRARREDSASLLGGKGTGHVFPSIPSALYNDPSSLTTDEAQRLLQSPAFLELLSRTADGPLDKGKKRAHADEDESVSAQAQVQSKQKQKTAPASTSTKPSAKRSKFNDADKPRAELKCWNCSRTKSSVWRARVMEDGTSVRVCNACGLYWNARKVMRPPSLWTAVDDDVVDRPVRQRKPVIRNAPVSRAASTPRSEGGTPTFKRTLSAAVNEDARRIAASKNGTLRKSGLSEVRVAARTSPVPSSAPSAAGRSHTHEHDFNNDNARPMPRMPMSDSGVPQRETQTRQAKFAPQLAPHPASDTLPAAPAAPRSDADLNLDWDMELSSMFDMDAYEAGTEPSHAGPGLDAPPTPLRRSPRKHGRGSSGGHSHGARSDGSRTTLSNLFPSNSSAPNSPSPLHHSTFDFSALPPSSPPVMADGLSHGMMPLSSPEDSPAFTAGGNGSPMDAPSVSSAGTGPGPVGRARNSPRKGLAPAPAGEGYGHANGSGLKYSYTPDNESFTLMQPSISTGGLSTNGSTLGGDAYGAADVYAPTSTLTSAGNMDVEMSADELARLIGESGMDQAGWEELLGLVSQTHTQTQAQGQAQGYAQPALGAMGGLGGAYAPGSGVGVGGDSMGPSPAGLVVADDLLAQFSVGADEDWSVFLGAMN